MSSFSLDLEVEREKNETECIRPIYSAILRVGDDARSVIIDVGCMYMYTELGFQEKSVCCCWSVALRSQKGN